ncbi:hypothetical protein [Pontibacillus salipaludis]|uniref:hypothetical protein n=1 Tax=Pontibacillus salipaludis TaxID=1697394 RepID=UPI0031EA158B
MRMKVGIGILVVAFLITGYFTYQKATADTYEGMSVIVEQEKDIPLYDGLKPKRSNYVLNGNKVEGVFQYYKKELRAIGWESQYIQSRENGFDTSWEKEGFRGELSVHGHYEEERDQTVVYFDKRPILTASTWINQEPSTLCVKENGSGQPCVTISDKRKVQHIVSFINEAHDTEKLEKHNQTYTITLGDQKVTVYYEEEAIIYLESAQGMKSLKPDPTFLEAIGIDLDD